MMSFFLSGDLSTIQFYLLVAALIWCVTYAVRTLLKIGSRPASLPPGPPTVPFWGNLKQVPADRAPSPILQPPAEPEQQLSGNLHPKLIYTEWARRHGPVYTVMHGAQPWIVVSGAAEASEIFHKRGQQTGGRPVNRMELALCNGFQPGFMSGPKWRVARKLWHAVLNVGAARQYYPLQELEAKQLLADVLRDGGDGGGMAWRTHVERYAGSLAMTMMNGQRVTSNADPTSREIVDDLARFAAHAISSAWLERIPFVWDVPEWMVPARVTARRIAGMHMDMIMRHWNTTKERIAAGLSLPCFNKIIMERLEDSDLEEHVTENEAAEIGEVLVTAATDTTATSLIHWVAAMAMFPEVQRKAQDEIDRVVGPDRLPNEADDADLPYVRQMIQELHRWITAVPLGMYHATTEPFQWGPYLIPPGTPMILNAYAIHRDPYLYPDPRSFKPERWEGKLESNTTLTDERLGTRSELFAFGAGRRICPGQHVAERGLFLAIARWLWVFNTRKAKDKSKGKEIEIDMDDVRPGFVNTLNDFPVRVEPRTVEKARLVEQLWSNAKDEFLDENLQWRKSPAGVERVMNRAVEF